MTEGQDDASSSSAVSPAKTKDEPTVPRSSNTATTETPVNEPVVEVPPQPSAAKVAADQPPSSVQPVTKDAKPTEEDDDNASSAASDETNQEDDDD